jgi:glycerate dehydrogenase
MVFAHLLNLALHVDRHAHTVRSGKWSSHPDFCYWETPLIELAGLTMGIVGFGRIGRATAEIALAFGMDVIAYDIDAPTNVPEGCRFVELDEVFRQGDVVSLHCPLTTENRNLVNEQRLAMMKEGAFLINTSRGPLIDEQALAQALSDGCIAGAGLDVLTSEPPEKGSPLLSAKNCFITPHISWATHAARERLLTVAVQNVAAYLAGEPQNVVNMVV